ncbi:MAG TPA: hypothetical protein VJS40_08570 [Aestuariivirgaceae bacterium]|nr:hypothetical protein [Aestuariivirgaceae bacterium]
MYAALLADLEASGLASLARSSTWLYPIANLVHVLGAALLVGAIAVFDVLLLRDRAQLAASIAATALAVAALGLLLQLASGSILLAAEATALGRNPAFIVKMVLIAVGLVNIAFFHWRWRSLRAGMPPAGVRLQAGVSLSVWVCVLLLGRLIAYV